MFVLIKSNQIKSFIRPQVYNIHINKNDYTNYIYIFCGRGATNKQIKFGMLGFFLDQIKIIRDYKRIGSVKEAPSWATQTAHR